MHDGVGIAVRIEACAWGATMSRFAITVNLLWLAATGTLVVFATPRLVGALWPSRLAHCEEAMHDFGVRDSDEKVVHEFHVRNVSDEKVWLAATPGCAACMKVTLSQTEADPHAAVIVRCDLDLRLLKGKVNKGTALKYLDGAGNPIGGLTLSLVGEVVPVIEQSPDEVLLRRDAIERGTIVRITLVARGGERIFKINKAISATDQWAVNCPLDTASGTHEVSIRCINPGPCNSYIQLTTDASWAPRIIVPIKVY